MAKIRLSAFADEYADGLTDQLYFLDEIDCRDLFNPNDTRERIMIFEMGGM